MPLDGHSYLASYGWSGNGNGLRSGAIDKPLTIPPKRNLSGVGKDRDDAFPFWDHLYSAATKAITIKIADDDENTNEDTSTTLQLKRTATGIISNRRPISGTPASGSSTPDSDAYPHASVMAIAKREAARKGLYSRFFRGPILAPDDPSNLSFPLASSLIHSANQNPVRQIVTSMKESTKQTSSHLETKEERRERKRLKRERREKKAAKKAAKVEKHETSKEQRRVRKEAKSARKALDKESSGNIEHQKPPGDVDFATVDQSLSHGRREGTGDAKRKRKEKKDS